MPNHAGLADSADMRVEAGQRRWLMAGAALLIAVLLLAITGSRVSQADGDPQDAVLGEARQGGLTVELQEAVGDIKVTQARAPGRPIVLIDPGHGGRDPGAPGISGQAAEKELTLAFSRELRDVLASRGRVRVALTRDSDRAVSLDQRAAIARQLGASLLISVHMDSAPNPLARGATIYSLSDVASDAEAARFAQAENAAGDALTSEADASVRFLLSDLALRGQMEQSADLAARLVRASRDDILLRPEPHKFAAFHILRRSEVPGILFEAGYISNAEDEAALMTAEGRRPIVEALARAIEVDLAVRSVR